MRLRSIAFPTENSQSFLWSILHVKRFIIKRIRKKENSRMQGDASVSNVERVQHSDRVSNCWTVIKRPRYSSSGCVTRLKEAESFLSVLNIEKRKEAKEMKLNETKETRNEGSGKCMEAWVTKSKRWTNDLWMERSL